MYASLKRIFLILFSNIYKKGKLANTHIKKQQMYNSEKHNENKSDMIQQVYIQKYLNTIGN